MTIRVRRLTSSVEVDCLSSGELSGSKPLPSITVFQGNSHETDGFENVTAVTIEELLIPSRPIS